MDFNEIVAALENLDKERFSGREECKTDLDYSHYEGTYYEDEADPRIIYYEEGSNSWKKTNPLTSKDLLSEKNLLEFISKELGITNPPNDCNDFSHPAPNFFIGYRTFSDIIMGENLYNIEDDGFDINSELLGDINWMDKEVLKKDPRDSSLFKWRIIPVEKGNIFNLKDGIKYALDEKGKVIYLETR